VRTVVANNTALARYRRTVSVSGWNAWCI